MTREEVFAELERRGAKCAIVAFSGGGDSGGADSIKLYDTVFHPDNTWPHPTPIAELHEECNEGLADYLSESIYGKYGSFADGGGFHVEGHVIWNVPEKTVLLTGTEHITNYESFSEEVE